jgi:hypothetical protein
MKLSVYNKNYKAARRIAANFHFHFLGDVYQRLAVNVVLEDAELSIIPDLTSFLSYLVAIPTTWQRLSLSLEGSPIKGKVTFTRWFSGSYVRPFFSICSSSCSFLFSSWVWKAHFWHPKHSSQRLGTIVPSSSASMKLGKDLTRLLAEQRRLASSVYRTPAWGISLWHPPSTYPDPNRLFMTHKLPAKLGPSPPQGRSVTLCSRHCCRVCLSIPIRLTG